MSALVGVYGQVLITSVPNVALTNEVLTDSGDHQTFNIASGSYAVKRYWDRTAAFSVQTSTDGGATWGAAAAGYTIRYVTGQVVLASALGGTPGCRISSGAYLPVSTFGNMKQWNISLARNLQDITTFVGNGGSRWKVYQPVLIGATIKLQQFYVDSTFFTIVQNGSTPNLFIVSSYTGRNAYERYEGYARLKQGADKTAVAAMIEEGLDMEADGQFYYFAGQYA